MGLSRPVSSENPYISVVVPTIPSRSHGEVVECLKEQRCEEPYEVIVVNDGSLDICEARNQGIREANGEIVALTDDDCRPPATWIQKIVLSFTGDPNLVCLEGRVRGGHTYEGERHYVGCNISFRRDLALQIGGFNSEFAGWRDDTEFGWRMEKIGKCEYKDEIVMNHPADTGSVFDRELEVKLRNRFPDKYHHILIPGSLLGKINNWLWRKGFFDYINNIKP